MKRMPAFKRDGYVSSSHATTLLEPLIEKEKSLGRDAITSVPDIYLDDISDDRVEATRILRQFRKNLPMYLASEDSMGEDMVHTKKQRQTTLGRLLSRKNVAEDNRERAVQVIQRIAKGGLVESQKEEVAPYESLLETAYGKDQMEGVQDEFTRMVSSDDASFNFLESQDEGVRDRRGRLVISDEYTYHGSERMEGGKRKRYVIVNKNGEMVDYVPKSEYDQAMERFEKTNKK